MGKIRATAKICLIGICLLILTGCRPLGVPWDYRSCGFRAQITWTSSENVGLCALAEVMEAEDPSAETRDMRLRILAPDSMKGIVLIRERGEVRVEYNGMVADGSHMSELLWGLELLLPTGDMRAVCETELEGREVLFAEVRKEGEEAYELYLDPETGVPREIRFGERRVEIQSFEALS